MAEKTIGELTAASGAPNATDIIEGERDPGGTPASEKLTWTQVAAGAAFTAAYAPFTPTVAALTPTTGSTDLDMATVDGKYLTHTLTGNPTYTSSNRAAGKTVTVKVIAGGSTRTLTFPAWTFVGAKPADIASGKTGILTVTFFDTTDAAAVAAWAVEA